MISRVLIGVIFLTFIQACGSSDTQVKLGKSVFAVPSKYIVSFEKSDESEGFDSGSNMISISFSELDELSFLDKPNGWLPKSPITALIYHQPLSSGIELESSLTEEKPKNDLHKVEFEGFYRLFEEGVKTRWLTINSDKAESISHIEIKCIALGGMDGVNKSRTDRNIPTSCKVVFKYNELVIRLSSTEENLITSYPIIQDVIIKKLSSWKQTSLDV